MPVQSVDRAVLAPSPEAIEQYYSAMRAFWHPVLPAANLAEGELRGVELLEEEIVLARLDGRIVAMQDLCRHFQAKLSIGAIRNLAGAGACIMCPYHGWSYDATGQCVDIPQLGPERKIPSEARVPTYLVEERYGLIWVCLSPEPTFPIPAFPELSDPSYLPGPIRTYEPWAASAPRVIMGALDDTHFPWVHEGLLGSRNNVAPPDHKVRRDGQYLVSKFVVEQPNNATVAEGEGETLCKQVALTVHVGVPNVIHFSIGAVESADQRRTAIWLGAYPRRYNLTELFWTSARNYDLDQPAWNPEFEAFQDTLRAQDKVIVESQRPWLLPPFWTKLELPLRPADLPLIEYQHWLEELGIAVTV